jgi:hypothetical protein
VRAIKTETLTLGMLWRWQRKELMSRAILQLTGMYSLGVFGEDESEDFKRK